MKILILYSGVHVREPAQEEMYTLLSKYYDIKLAKDREFFDVYESFKPDIVWLDVYHSRSAIDWQDMFNKVKVPVIIDEADNELFVKLDRQFRFDKAVLTSRCLPNKSVDGYCKKYNIKAMVMPWYVDPNRFPRVEKTIDVGFVCWPKGKRIAMTEQLKDICKRNNYSIVYGNFYGQDYIDAISKCKVFVVECDRKCVTQKYLEASLAGCTIVGDVPEYPANDIKVYPLDKGLEEMIRQALDKPIVNEIQSSLIPDFQKIVSYLKS